MVSISAGSCLIDDSATYGTAAARAVKIAFGAAFSFTCDNVARHRYVVLRFQWVDALETYAYPIDVDTPLASDIVLCALEWSGSSIARVDTASATKGFRDKFDLIIKNLEPLASATVDRTVSIAAGRFVYGHGSVAYAGGTVQLDASSNASGRYDIVGLTSAGAPYVVKGTEGGSVPSFGAFLPIVVVHVRQGVTRLLQSDLLDVRPFLTFSGVVSDADVYIDTTGFNLLPTTLLSVRAVFSWLNTHLGDGSAVNAKSVQGHEPSDTPFATGHETTLPTATQIQAQIDSAVAAAVASLGSSLVAQSDQTYNYMQNVLNRLRLRDVGLVSWFAVAPSVGWLRADGSVIDKSVNPEYTFLVDRIRAEVNGDATHPCYDASPNRVKLPDLRDAYVKDVGSSGRKIGSRILGSLMKHLHTITVSAASPDAHTHSMNHLHDNTGKATGGPSDRSVSVTVPAHQHDLVVPKQTIQTSGKSYTFGTGQRYGSLDTSKGNELTTVTEGSSPIVFDVPSQSLKSANAAAVTASGENAMANHTHPVPATDTFSGQTGSASPASHDHTATAGETGDTDTNEVTNVALRAYICYGYDATVDIPE